MLSLKHIKSLEIWIEQMAIFIITEYIKLNPPVINTEADTIVIPRSVSLYPVRKSFTTQVLYCDKPN